MSGCVLSFTLCGYCAAISCMHFDETAFKEEKSSGNAMMIVMILLVLAGLGGAAYLFS